MNKLISKKKLRKLMRYIIMFLSVFISSQFIPECTISYTTAFSIASVAAVAFAIIDMQFPLLPMNESN
ncbi:hypothetical protein Indivirus_4_27 [Indivirus ILV1]|uniref:Uncharacterized protein n=1 Tax=Indivirus ILV1 TaxID=1977633 RepID=A0A1V0SDR8_9VIRU|nr:hypothetical protein Indivirus_4_27 [Indivirus ILV1]